MAYRPITLDTLYAVFYIIFAVLMKIVFKNLIVLSVAPIILTHKYAVMQHCSLFTCISSFLRASAMLKHVIAIGLTSVRPSVCPSVRPSQAGIVSKRLNILSCFLHHTIAHSF